MLANDTTVQKKLPAFFLHVENHRAVADLMAECPRCGAFTACALELAWRLRIVTCSECGTTMALGVTDLMGLRARLIEVRIRIDRLIDTGTDDVS